MQANPKAKMPIQNVHITTHKAKYGDLPSNVLAYCHKLARTGQCPDCKNCKYAHTHKIPYGPSPVANLEDLDWEGAGPDWSDREGWQEEMEADDGEDHSQSRYDAEQGEEEDDELTKIRRARKR